MRKYLLFLMSVLLVASMLLVACGSAPAEEPMVEEPAAEEAVAEEPAAEEAVVEEVEEPAAEEPAEEPMATGPSGKLVIWVQQANQDVWEQTVLPGFREEYPAVELEFVNYSPSEVANQVALAIQGGTGVPDLAVTENRSITALVELGGLMDLTQQIAPYKADLNATILDYCSKDGKNYCVPWDIGPVVTFYRRDIFEAAGFASDPDSVSELVATWDDYLATCTTIKEETGLNCFAMNKANNYGDLLFNMLWSQGLGLYNADGQVTIDSPEVVAALEKLGMFWEADVVSDSLEWTDPWYAELNAAMDNTDTPPVASIVIAGWMGNFLKTWIAADQAGNWGIALMPAYETGGVRSSNQGGSNFFIPEGSQNKDAAWAFIEYINLDPANHVAQFVYSDYFPAVSSTYSDPLFQEPDPYFGDQVTRAFWAEVAQNMPYGYIYGQYAVTMSGNTATAIQNYALGNMSAEEALGEAADAVRLETGMP
ncbi:MAG: sugar ABC transporter substrate-binding protein [Anaerolineales bacterium]|nr:sugar ABC transporter substrate-binding protein [Anaerolineales bacterium]